MVLHSVHHWIQSGHFQLFTTAEYTQVDFTRNHDSKEERLEHVSDTSETCSGHIQNTLETCSEHVLNASETGQTAFKSASENIPVSTSDAVQIGNSAKVQRKRKELYRQIKQDLYVVTDNSLPTQNAFIHKEGQPPVINPFGFNAEVFGHAPAFWKIFQL